MPGKKRKTARRPDSAGAVRPNPDGSRRRRASAAERREQKHKQHVTLAVATIFLALNEKGREQFEAFCLQHRLLIRCNRCQWNIPICDKVCGTCRHPVPTPQD